MKKSINQLLLILDNISITQEIGNTINNRRNLEITSTPVRATIQAVVNMILPVESVEHLNRNEDR